MQQHRRFRATRLVCHHNPQTGINNLSLNSRPQRPRIQRKNNRQVQTHSNRVLMIIIDAFHELDLSKPSCVYNNPQPPFAMTTASSFITTCFGLVYILVKIQPYRCRGCSLIQSIFLIQSLDRQLQPQNHIGYLYIYTGYCCAHQGDNDVPYLTLADNFSSDIGVSQQ